MWVPLEVKVWCRRKVPFPTTGSPKSCDEVEVVFGLHPSPMLLPLKGRVPFKLLLINDEERDLGKESNQLDKFLVALDSPVRLFRPELFKGIPFDGNTKVSFEFLFPKFDEGS